MVNGKEYKLFAGWNFKSWPQAISVFLGVTFLDIALIAFHFFIFAELLKNS